MIIIKGKLVGLGLKQQLKSRQTNSSIGYFDLNGKAIVPYNLKQYLRAMSAPRLQMELSKATSGKQRFSKFLRNFGELCSKKWANDTSI